MSRHVRSAHNLMIATRVLFGAMAILCQFAVASLADTIRAIDVTGQRTVAPETITSFLNLDVGTAWDDAAGDRALKALFASGVFADARISFRDGRLLVTVTENPIVGAVSYAGNKDVEKAKLDEIVQLKPKARYTAAKGQAEALRIRDHYRHLGRMATTVTARTTAEANGTVDVTFDIKEAAVTKIARIAFDGNHAFTERQLRDVVSTSESGWFDILKSAAFYDADRIDDDRDRIRRYYESNGYPEVRVTAADARPTDDGTAYTVTFRIEEGKPATFGDIRVDVGHHKISARILEDGIVARSGTPYNRDKIEATIEALSQILMRNGLIFARIDIVPKRIEARIDIVVKVVDTPRLYVERIEVTGHTKTKDATIRREVQMTEGDAVNAFVLERARKRLKALGYFKSVSVKSRPSKTPERVVVEIKVEEDETMVVGFGVGYSTTEGVVGDVSIVEKNLFGNGQNLSLKLAGSTSRLQATLGFTEPHFLGTNVAAGFDLFYKDFDYTTQASYKSQKIGGTLRTAYPITEEVTGSLNYTFVHNRIYDVGDNASAAIKEAVAGSATGSSSYNTSSVGYGLAYDTRDKKRSPTSGTYFALNQDLAGAGGDVKYLRSTGEARAYYAVNDDVTLAGRAQGGIIGGWGGNDVRLLDMFYKGNDLVRGFAVAGVGPRDTLSANSDALGGRTFVGSSAEVLFQIPGVSRDVGLRGAVFFDAGSLWGTSKTAASLPGVAGGTPSLRASAGVGLAWDSPIGALRADYAFPLVKSAFDKTQPFSFGLSPF